MDLTNQLKDIHDSSVSCFDNGRTMFKMNAKLYTIRLGENVGEQMRVVYLNVCVTVANNVKPHAWCVKYDVVFKFTHTDFKLKYSDFK